MLLQMTCITSEIIDLDLHIKRAVLGRTILFRTFHCTGRPDKIMRRRSIYPPFMQRMQKLCIKFVWWS